ncbi:MAG: hypothetical protein KatS3mg023_0460 [Armatimonadota bacterium]|nr:MAG: hypothetical protein KatS3mg023_0460 [Armatimonadota bacterium]
MAVRILGLTVLWLSVFVPAFAGTGNIGVYVYDLKTGSEVRQFTARIVGSQGTNITLDSGTKDYVRFNNLSTQETFTLTVSRDGYYSRSIPAIIVSKGNTRDFSLALTPTSGVGAPFPIRGRVVDAVTNLPVPNATVEGYRAAAGQSFRSVYAVTDNQGRFVIPQCVPGTYWFVASRVGYNSSPDFELYATGEVTDLLLPCAPHGTPLGSWRLYRFYDALGGYELRHGECLLRSEAGWTMRFTFWDGSRLERLPANHIYSATVRYTNTDVTYHPSTRVDLRLVEGETVDETFSLVRADMTVGTLTGIVRNMLDGSPVPNAWVQLRYEDRPIYSMFTDAQGRYSFANVPRDYRGLNLNISKPGWRSYTWNIPALSASSTTIDLFTCPNWTPVGNLRFWIRDEPARFYIDGATLRITLPTGQSTLVDMGSGNSIRVSGLPAWMYYNLTVSATGYRSATSLSQSVPYNSERELEYYLLRANQSTGRLIGTVRDLFTGNPIPNAKLSAYREVRADSTGQYVLGDLPLETLDVRVEASGYRTRVVTVAVRSGDNLRDFFLVPAEYPSGRVYGDVRSAVDNGSEIPNSTVIAVAPNGLTLTDDTGPTSGRYEFRDLPHDMPFTLTASSPGWNSASVENYWPKLNDVERIDFSLNPIWGMPRMRTLQGNIVLEGFEGNPATVWLTVEAYQHGAPVWRSDVHPRSDGSFEVHCPVEGVVDLRLKADRWISVWLDGYDLRNRQLPTLIFTELGDTNNDDSVDLFDFGELVQRFGQKEVNPPDLNGDGWVDLSDVLLMISHFGAMGRQ